MATNERVKALAKYLEYHGNDVDVADLEPVSYDKCVIQDGRMEYLVLSDKEADKRVSDYIKDSVWAFNADFIAHHAKMSYDAAISVVKALQPQCEGANEAITGIIRNMKKFIADAVSADGRGHFLNHYNGSEDDVKLGNKRYYIYRLN